MSGRLPASAEVRWSSDLHQPSVHPQGRPKQPRQAELRAKTAKRSSGGQRTKQRPQRLTGERNQSQARQSRPASPRTALLPRSLPQATGPSGSPQWCRPQADPPAPARRRSVREPARDSPQNSRPPTPKPQPQSSTNTDNLQCCCVRPTSSTHQECLRPAEATFAHLPGPHCAITTLPPALRAWAGGQSGPRTNRTPHLPLPSSSPDPAASACPAWPRSRTWPSFVVGVSAGPTYADPPIPVPPALWPLSSACKQTCHGI